MMKNLTKMHKEVISVMLWQVGRFCAWQFDWINQPAAQKLSRYMFLKCIKPFPLKVNTQGTQRLKNLSVKRHANNRSNHVVAHEYLINGLQGHPVYGLVSNGSFLLRLWNDEFAVLRKVFRRFLNRKFEDPFECLFRLDHINFDLVVFRMSNYAWKTNFWCHFDWRANNQSKCTIAPCS